MTIVKILYLSLVRIEPPRERILARRVTLLLPRDPDISRPDCNQILPVYRYLLPASLR